MALISSLIQLQQEMSDSNQMDNYFESTVSRIHSMALVHERLYHTETFSSIRMDEYVNELIESARKKYCSNSEALKVMVDSRPVTLSIKQSIPAGLLLNELLINAFKYGSKDGKGKVEVLLHQDKDEVFMKVSDNGPGFPDGVEFENPKTLGMTLISSLIKQLNATYKLTVEDGISFSIRFKSRAKMSKTA
jgi:two-component sensor histidine kinase